MAFRGFVAAEVGPLASLAALQRELGATGADLSPVDPDLFHVTLRFLGNVPEVRVDALEAAMRGAVAGVPPGRLDIQGAGVFPNPRRPRVLWAGVRDPQALTRIVDALEGPLAALGFPPEHRAFHAHVTVARVRSGRGRDRLLEVLARHETSTFGSVPWNDVVLKRSDLGPQGPVYRDVRRVPLEA